MRVDITINAEVGDGTNKIGKGGSKVMVCEEVEEKKTRVLWCDSDPSSSMQS